MTCVCSLILSSFNMVKSYTVMFVFVGFLLIFDLEVQTNPFSLLFFQKKKKRIESTVPSVASVVELGNGSSEYAGFGCRASVSGRERRCALTLVAIP